jgi:hypothetical protein
MGVRTKGNPPRKRGPKPERVVRSGKQGVNGGPLKQRPPEAGWPQPKDKGRGK